MDAQRLIDLEQKFAPAIEKGPGVFSPLDKSTHAPWNLGGDKMSPDRNNYAAVYSRLFDGFTPQMVVELGVFRGVSLAMWSELWPEAMVVGLDLDFDRYHEHLPTLVGRGAFPSGQPILHRWDAYGDDVEFLSDLPGIDLFVDDGPHRADAIENTIRLIVPLMNPGSIYVIEDFAGGADILDRHFPESRRVYAGNLNAVYL